MVSVNSFTICLAIQTGQQNTLTLLFQQHFKSALTTASFVLLLQLFWAMLNDKRDKILNHKN